MSQWQVFERDCAAFDVWLTKAELLLARQEDAEKSFALAPQTFMDSYQDVLKTCKRQGAALAALETSVKQFGSASNQQAKVKSLKERYGQLEENNLESWLQTFQLFFEEVLTWISRADQVAQSVDNAFRDKSPPTLCQELLDQLPQVQQAFTACEEKANVIASQCPEWFNEQLMASKPKLFELQQQLEKQLEEVRIASDGGEEFNQAAARLEKKIAQAEGLIAQELNEETGMSVTVVLDKYRDMCHPEWLQDGDDLVKEVERLADQTLKSGRSRGVAQLENRLLSLSETWESVKSQLLLERRVLEFQLVQSKMDGHLEDGLNELDNMEIVQGPLENLLRQEQSYREFFEELQFESIGESHLRKMRELAEEDKQETGDGQSTANYDDIIGHVTGKLRRIMELAAKLRNKLENSINRWTVFETEKSDVELWLEEREKQLSELVVQCEQQGAEWSGFEDIDRVLEGLMLLSQESDEYGDVLAPFVETGEHLREECDTEKAGEHDHGVKNLENRYEHLRVEVEELTRPLTALRSSWHSFVNVSVEMVEWLDAAHALLQESSQVEKIEEAELCVKKHKDFFTPQALKLENSKLTHLTQLLQEVTAPRGNDRISRPSHLSTNLQQLNDRYTHVCQLQQSELEFLETLWRYLQVAADIEQYLQEIDSLLSELESDSQSQEKLQRLQSLLHDLMPKQESLRGSQDMRVKLQQLGGDRKVPSSPDELNHRFQEIKTKQAALFQRRETEDEARELIGDVQKDIGRARELIKYEIKCEIAEEEAQIKRLKDMKPVLTRHIRAVSDLNTKLTSQSGSHSSLQRDIAQLISHLKRTLDDMVNVEGKCQDALVLVDGMKRAVKEVDDHVGEVETALKIPWRKDSTARKLVLRVCQSAVSESQVNRQNSNLSAGRESLNALATFAPSNCLFHATDVLKQAEKHWGDAVKRGRSRIRMIQFEQLLSEAREKMSFADAHLKKLEPILGPTAQIETQLHGHLEYFLDDFETAMDAVRNSLAKFVQSSPSPGDELTRQDVQQKSDEIRSGTESLQSEHRRLKVAMETALNEWQKFDQKREEFGEWLRGSERQFEELRDVRHAEGKRDRDRKLKALADDIDKSEAALTHILDVGHRLCQTCVEPGGSQMRNQLSELKRRFDQLSNQTTAVTEAESEVAGRLAEYKGRVQLLTSWLVGVDNHQLEIGHKERVSEDDKRILQGILHEEAARREELTGIESSYDVLSQDPGSSLEMDDDLKPDVVRNRFDRSLGAAKRCLVTALLNEADEVLRKGEETTGDQARFNDALEEQEAFFVDSPHLENVENILQEMEAYGGDQTDGDAEPDTTDLRERFDAVSAKEPQVHSRLASAIAAWKQHDELRAELEERTVQCNAGLAECRDKPMAVSPQEMAERISQLETICEQNNQLFDVANSLSQQIRLLVALATPEQHQSMAKSIHDLNTGLNETARTVAEMNGHMKERLSSANERTENLESACEELERRVSDLDARVKSLPSIEYDVEPLNVLSQMIEAMQDELDIYRGQLEKLQLEAAELVGFLDSSVAGRLQTLDCRLDDLSAGVAGKDVEVSAAARTTQEVTEKLDTVENDVRALASHFQGELQDQLRSLESPEVTEYLENLQACHGQVEKLRPQLTECLKPLSAVGDTSTRALESRAESLALEIDHTATRGSTQLQSLDDVIEKLSQVESDVRDISKWTDVAKEMMASESSPQQLEDLEAQLEKKKAKLSGVRVNANTLKSTYPHIDNRALSDLVADVRPKLHEVQDTLAIVRAREKSPSEGNGLEVDIGQFDDLYNPVMVWLEDIETRLEAPDFTTAQTVEEIEWKINQCQGIQSDMDGHTPDYDDVCGKADELKLALPESQHPIFDRKLKELDNKWATVADMLTNILGELRDHLERLMRDTAVVAGYEAWLEEKKRWLHDLHDNESQLDNVSDVVDNLKELRAELAERQTALEESPEESAAELARQFAEFSNDVNDAQARLHSESQWVESSENKVEDVNRRLTEIESWMDAMKDVGEMSASEVEDELTQGQSYSQSCEEMLEEVDELVAGNDTKSMEMTFTLSESDGGYENAVGERLKVLKSALDQRCRELLARKGVKHSSSRPRTVSFFFLLSCVVAILLVIVAFMEAPFPIFTVDNEGRPSFLTRRVEESNPY